MNKELKNMQDEVTVEELQQLSGEAGRMSYEENVDYAVDMLKAQIVYKVKDEMMKRKMSRSALAKEMKTSRQYVSRILQETANFTLKTIAELAVALNLRATVGFSGSSVGHEHEYHEKEKFVSVRSFARAGMKEPKILAA